MDTKQKYTPPIDCMSRSPAEPEKRGSMRELDLLGGLVVTPAPTFTTHLVFCVPCRRYDTGAPHTARYLCVVGSRLVKQGTRPNKKPHAVVGAQLQLALGDPDDK